VWLSRSNRGWLAGADAVAALSLGVLERLVGASVERVEVDLLALCGADAK
jgi:hypothetical protein